jgi:hypothetical protein
MGGREWRVKVKGGENDEIRNQKSEGMTNSGFQGAGY